MTGKEDRARSKYVLIAEDLRAAIRDGRYGPGDRLPGENALMEQYDVARMTARQALDVLKSEGLAVARRGSGTVVREFQPLRRHGIQRLSREQWGAGRSVWDADLNGRTLSVDRVQVSQDDVPRHLAAVLELAEGDRVVVRSRRFVLEGKPVLSATSYLPSDIAAGTPIEETDTGPGGIYARLKDLGHAPVHFREEIRSRMPMPDEAEELELTSGTPVLLICRTAYTAEGRPVEVNEMTLDASAYVLEYDFDG